MNSEAVYSLPLTEYTELRKDADRYRYIKTLQPGDVEYLFYVNEGDIDNAVDRERGAK
jgi:hypothetical protein